MKCEKVKGFLLTGYIDDEIDASLKKDIDNHIAGCDSCRDYKLNLGRNLTPLFEKTEASLPEDEIWNNIKSRIAKDKQRKEGRIFVINPYLRKGIFALAAAALLFMVISFKAINSSQKDALNRFLLEEGLFLHSLSVDISQEVPHDAGFGTNIEEWFM
jgi:predicted anti-sigma-YlaC factor YlaD